MNWLKNLIYRIFKNDNIQPLPESTLTNTQIFKSKDEFIIQLKSVANPEQDDKNGYGIQRNFSLKDMI